VLQKQGIECIVAPYEADAQLAYLEKIHLVDAILTEDSDLLVFGCQRVIFKLDATGNAVQIYAKDFPHVPAMKREWSFDKFRQACILSGCDYLPSLKGVGLKKAFDSIGSFGSAEKTLRIWKTLGKTMNAPPWRQGYEIDFKEAELTFLYQRVYDPIEKKLVYLNDPTQTYENTKDMSRFLGPDLEPTTAQGIAEGRINPYTLKPYNSDDSFLYDEERYNTVSVRASRKLETLPAPIPFDLSTAQKILHLNSFQPAYVIKSVASATSSRYFPQKSDFNLSQSSEKTAVSLTRENSVSSNQISPSSQESLRSKSSDLEPPAMKISSILFSKFQNTEAVAFSDEFSYHSTVARKILIENSKVGVAEEEQEEEDIAIDFENDDPIEALASISSRAKLNLSRFKCNDGEYDGTLKRNNEAWNNEISRKFEKDDQESASFSTFSEQAQYMQWDTKPKYHSPKTQEFVKAAVETSATKLGIFRPYGEQNLYSIPKVAAKALSSTKTPLPQKKRLGAGRPSNSHLITRFFSKK
ncbi:Rad2 nuclease, partial [Physocladia obscura]